MVRLNRTNLDSLPLLKTNFSSKEELIEYVLNDGYTIEVWKAFNSTFIPNDKSHIVKQSFDRSTWRLTWWGASNFVCSHQNWEIKLDPTFLLSGKTLINLNRIISGPWTIVNNCLYVWDQDLNFEIKLFDNDIKQFIMCKTL